MGKSFSDVRRAQRGLEEFVETIDDSVAVAISEDDDGYGFLVLVPSHKVGERIPPTFDDIPVTIEIVTQPAVLSH